jgi:hypothetical protein
LRRNKMWQWKNSLDVKFISLGRLVSAFRTPTAHAREISITKNKKKNGKNLFPRNLSPGVLLMFSSLGGYRWRSPSDRLVRYNEILVLLPPSSIQKCQERRNWCTTSKGALYSGCWTLFDWGEDSIGRNDLESIHRLFSINTLDSFLPSRWIRSLWIPC